MGRTTRDDLIKSLDLTDSLLENPFDLYNRLARDLKCADLSGGIFAVKSPRAFSMADQQNE